MKAVRVRYGNREYTVTLESHGTIRDAVKAARLQNPAIPTTKYRAIVGDQWDVALNTYITAGEVVVIKRRPARK